MPWVCDVEGDLVNLDHCEAVFVTEEFEVIAQRDANRNDGCTILYKGRDEDHCKVYLENIALLLGVKRL